MRIVHATDFFAPRVGGIETQVADLARAQTGAARDVHVLTTTPREGASITEIWPFPVCRVTGGFGMGQAVRPFVAARIRLVLDELDPDVVHAHVSAVSPCAWCAVHWALQRDRPVVASVHSLWGGVAGSFHRLLDRRSGWAERVAVAPVSALAATQVSRAVPAAHTLIVPNGIDVQFWRDQVPSDRVGDIHVVSVARLVGRRRSMVLLDVLRAARRRLGSQLTATIAGDGPDRRRMVNYLHRHAMTSWVRLVGRLCPVGVRSLLADADIYLNVALRESFGIAALEARTSGVPVVALAGTGTADFIGHEREGILCHDTPGLVDALVRLARDHDLRHRIAAHNRSHPPLCTWPAVLAAFDRCYSHAFQQVRGPQKPALAIRYTTGRSHQPEQEARHMAPISKAIILAAGKGRRLGFTEWPKPLTPVNGIPILHRSLTSLASAGVRHAVIVVGYRADDIIAHTAHRFGDLTVTYRYADAYEHTNNSYSLWCAREELDQDLFLLDGDVVFDADILRYLADSDAALAIAVAPRTPAMNGTMTTVSGDTVSHVYLIKDQPDPVQGSDLLKTVNISLLRAKYLETEFVPRLEQLINRGGHHEFYDAVIAETVNGGRVSARAVDCRHLRWQEIDEPADLAAAEYQFGTADQQLDTLSREHGSYWRYPITDHSLLYNLHFPPEEMWHALAGQLRDVLIQYPGGQDTARALLGAAIGQPPERLAVANGASELIKVLGPMLGHVVLTSPGFNEYEAVTDTIRTDRVELAWPEFRIDIDDIHGIVLDGGANAVVVDSPNNTTGRATPSEELLRLCKLLAAHGTRLVVDESFIDFCEDNQTLERHLGDHPNLLIIKSMSKAFGLAGLRLGYLASADKELVAAVIARLPIWNINGMAEAFLRHLPRYTDNFEHSLEQVRTDRDELHAGLSTITGLETVTSDANFVLARLTPPWTAQKLTERLFAQHNILIKDCTSKSMRHSDRYVRIASRTSIDNQRLVSAITSILNAWGPLLR